MVEKKDEEAFQTEQEQKRQKAKAEADEAATRRAQAEANAAQKRKEEAEAEARRERARAWRETTYRVLGQGDSVRVFLASIAAAVVEKTVKAAGEAEKTAAQILADRFRFWLALASAISEAGVLLFGMAYVWHKRSQDSNGNNIADRLERIFQVDPERVKQEDPQAYAILCEVHGAPKNAQSR
jgi:hypothetical protein